MVQWIDSSIGKRLHPIAGLAELVNNEVPIPVHKLEVEGSTDVLALIIVMLTEF